MLWVLHSSQHLEWQNRSHARWGPRSNFLLLMRGLQGLRWGLFSHYDLHDSIKEVLLLSWQATGEAYHVPATHCL